MANAEARALVRTLQDRGLSQAAIGRAVGLNSSAISQIAADKRGEGYGAAAVSRLASLVAETGQARNRTQTQGIASGFAARVGGTRPGGRAQRVRQPTRPVGAPTASARGESLRGTGAGSGAALDRVLTRAESNGQRVSLRVEVTLADGGTRWLTIDRLPAATWRYMLGFPGGDASVRERLSDALGALADSGELGSDFEDVTGNFQVNVEALA